MMECLRALSISGQLRPKAPDILPHLKAYRLVKTVFPGDRRTRSVSRRFFSKTRCPHGIHVAAIPFRSARTLPHTIMKPQLQNSHEPRLFRGGSIRTGSPFTYPVTDYRYLGTLSGFRGRPARLKPAATSGTPSFREVSNDFIKSEMKWQYVAEASFFAIIVAVSTWPIVSMVRAMADLVK